MLVLCSIDSKLDCVVGISIEGDEELLAVTKEPPKRDEWMTTLPPERKVRLLLLPVSDLQNLLS